MKKLLTFKVFGLIMLMALAGCSRKTVAPIVVPVHDTLYRNSVQYDTAFVDRWHSVTQKGDTVRLHDSVVVYRAQFIHDTTHNVQTLTVEVPIVKTEYVEKALPWYRRCFMWLGRLMVLSFVAWLLYKGYRLWQKG